MNIYTILKEFLFFFKYVKLNEKLVKNNLFSIINLITINTIIVVFSSFFMLTVFSIVEILANINLRASTRETVLNSYTKYEFLAIGVLLGPILEELCFRYPLKISKISLSTFLALFLGVFLSKWLFPKWPIMFRIELSSVFLIFFYLFIRESFLSKINSKYWYYLCSFLFGIIHLRNQKYIEWYEIILSPIITVPQIAMGFFLGYVRIRFNLMYSIIVHIANNLLVFLIKY